MKWEPIETAPKDDGLSVLGFCNGTVSEWEFDSFHEEWEPVRYDQHGCGCCSGNEDQPTHWMPLPAPPAT